LQTLVAALAVLLLAAGLTACGGGDSSSSTATEAREQAQVESKSSGTSKTSDDEGKSGSGSGGGQSDASGSGGSASDFTPKQHSDSGGGSQQFRVKGGDNSVQEFGEEADTSDFDAAAATVHNFLDARAEGNWAAACEYMSQGLVASFEKLGAQAQQIENPSCAGVLQKLINPDAKDLMIEEAAQADVRSLRLEGEQAFAIYTGPDGTVFSMPMTNEDGEWKVNSLTGTPLS
jgi:hypothetical protein